MHRIVGRPALEREGFERLNLPLLLIGWVDGWAGGELVGRLVSKVAHITTELKAFLGCCSWLLLLSFFLFSLSTSLLPPSLKYTKQA